MYVVHEELTSTSTWTEYSKKRRFPEKRRSCFGYFLSVTVSMGILSESAIAILQACVAYPVLVAFFILILFHYYESIVYSPREYPSPDYTESTLYPRSVLNEAAMPMQRKWRKYQLQAIKCRAAKILQKYYREYRIYKMENDFKLYKRMFSILRLQRWFRRYRILLKWRAIGNNLYRTIARKFVSSMIQQAVLKITNLRSSRLNIQHNAITMKQENISLKQNATIEQNTFTLKPNATAIQQENNNSLREQMKKVGKEYILKVFKNVAQVDERVVERQRECAAMVVQAAWMRYLYRENQHVYEFPTLATDKFPFTDAMLQENPWELLQYNAVMALRTASTAMEDDEPETNDDEQLYEDVKMAFSMTKMACSGQERAIAVHHLPYNLTVVKRNHHLRV